MNIFKLVEKDIKIFAKSKSSIILTYLVPMVLALIFGGIFGGFGTGGGRREIKLLLTDQDQSQFSRAFTTELDSLSEIKVYRNYTQEEEEKLFTADVMDDLIKKGKFAVGLIIPDSTESNLQQGGKLSLQIHYDPKYPIEHGIVSGLIQKLIPTKFPQLMMSGLWKLSEGALGKESDKFKNEMFGVVKQFYPEADEGLFDFSKQPLVPLNSGSGAGDSTSVQSQGFGLGNMMEIESVELLGQEEENQMFAQYIAGMAVMFLLFAVSGTATSLIEERNFGTMKRLLVAPVRSSEILYSKLIFCSLLGISQLIVMFIFGWLVFKLDIFKDPLALSVTILSTSLACSGLGILMATICKTERQVGSLSTLVVLGMSALGGSMVPTIIMPAFIQNIGKFTINHWAMKGFTDIFWRNMHLKDIIVPNLILLGVFVVLISLSHYFFKQRIYENS
jgi:linearmycin/streptolysin S transport system permease protein